MQGQNLVPNPSFEDTLPNPVWNGWIESDCALWKTSLPGNAAYLNDSNPIVPGVASLLQIPRTGNAWADIYTNASAFGQPDERELIQIQLTEPLISGKKYCLSFWVSLYDQCNYQCNSFGAMVSDSFLTNSNSILNYTPTINNDGTINPLGSDTTWTEISGTFIANGGEQYLIIGNFKNDATSDTVYLGSRFLGADFSIYLIDDVSLYLCEDSVINSTIIIPNAFSPNGDGTNDFFLPQYANLKTYHCTVFNRWGNIVFETSEISNVWNGQYNGSDCAEGVYYYVIDVVGEDEMEYYKGGFVMLMR